MRNLPRPPDLPRPRPGSGRPLEQRQLIVDIIPGLARRCSASPAGWLAVAASLLLALPIPARALDAADWKNVQSLVVERAGVLRFALPPETLGLARPGLTDLRLLDPEGREVSFAFTPPAPTIPPTVRNPIAFRTLLAGTATQLLIETGTRTPIDAITLATPAPAFLKAGQLEISSDGNNWETLVDRAVLFRQFGATHLRLVLPRRTASHLRVTIDDSRSRPIPFVGATLELAGSTPPDVAEPIPVHIARRDEFAGESVLVLDLGGANVPLASLEFATAEPLFARRVALAVRELQNETTVERVLGTGSIWRVAAEGVPADENLAVTASVPVPSRELLVHLDNGDSPPVAIASVKARQHPVWLVFHAALPGTYQLLTGNPQAAAPRYDLATLAGALREVAPTALMPGPAATNPSYRRPDALADTPLLGAALDPAPWTWRKPVRLAAAGVQELEFDLAVLAHAQAGFADPRLVRDGTQVPYLLERPALSRSTPLEFAPANDPKRPRISRWQIKLPGATVPFTRLTLASATPLFQRELRLYKNVPTDRGEVVARTLAGASWSKTPGRDRPLTIDLPAAPDADTLFLETDNGDNPPLALSSVQATYPVVRILFKAPPGLPAGESSGGLELYYGNAAVGAPRYDLALVAAQILAAEKSVATLGPEEKGSAAGWSAGGLAGLGGGPLFWGALAVVVVVLLVVVARLLPKPPAPTP